MEGIDVAGASGRDVFISYSSRDRAAVAPVVQALADGGLDLWYDQDELGAFDSRISARIEQGIAATRVTLALLSPDYLASDACKWELVSTLRAGGLDRLLLVPLPGYHPRLHMLRENMHARLPSTAIDSADFAATVKALIAGLREPAGTPTPRWWGGEWAGAGFSGRLDERLALFSALTSHVGKPGSDTQPSDRVQIVGLGGQGKSMLALQHGLDNAGAFRAIARFDAGGDRRGGRVSDPLGVFDDLLAQLQDWITDESPTAGLPTPQLPKRSERNAWRDTRTAAADLVSALGGQVLWIIDDVPAGLPPSRVQDLLCPGRGRTIMTTRGRDYISTFPGEATIALPDMDLPEAIYLLASGDGDLMAEQGAALAQIAREVGCHTLSLAVLAPRIAALPVAQVLAAITDRRAGSIEQLERAAAKIKGFPDGHRASVVRTLRMSIEATAAEEPTAWQIMLLAAAWPTSQPIPFDLLGEVVGGDYLEGVQALHGASLAEKYDEDSLRVHAQIAGVAAWMLEQEPDEADVRALDGLRDRAAQWLIKRPGDEWDDADHGEVAWHLLAPIRARLTGAGRVAAARALMAMARLPMRHKPGTLTGAELVEYLEAPIGWARLAGELQAGSGREPELGQGRALAMEGLLLMSQAAAEPDPVSRLALANRGREQLEASVAIRKPWLADSDRPGDRDELVRAYFNFGRLLTMAKILAATGSGPDVAKTLDAAQEAYERARDARVIDLRGQDARSLPIGSHENLASCHRGLAIVAITRVTHQPDLQVEQRRALLDQAGVELLAARANTAMGRERLTRAGKLSPGQATADQTKDLQVQTKVEVLRFALDHPEKGPDLIADLATLSTIEAERAVGDHVPWGATDPVLPTGTNPGWLPICCLIVQAERGGRGVTAGRTIHELRCDDLPALARTRDAAESGT